MRLLRTSYMVLLSIATCIHTHYVHNGGNFIIMFKLQFAPCHTIDTMVIQCFNMQHSISTSKCDHRYSILIDTYILNVYNYIVAFVTL